MSLRHSVVAGHFYPADAQTLLQEVQHYLSAGAELAARSHGGTLPEKTPAAMVMLPHAGYVYCGQIIGQTLAQTSLPSTLVLLGPNHTGRGKPLSVWPGGHWETPLGQVPVDTELTQQLLAMDAGFQPDKEAHLQEHSLEVLIPFLQTQIPDLRIVPIAVSGVTIESLQKAGQALGHVIKACKNNNRPVSMIVSSDMNHFADQENTLRLDEMALKQVLRLDATALVETVHCEKISMCGVYPAVVAITACNSLEIKEAVFSGHATSGQVNGDFSRVVGYAGIYVPLCACQKRQKRHM